MNPCLQDLNPCLQGLLEQAGELADQLKDLGLRARAMELLAECSLQDKGSARKTVIVRWPRAEPLCRTVVPNRMMNHCTNRCCAIIASCFS